MKVTRDAIVEKNACAEGVAVFEKYYPGGEWEVTPESCGELSGIFPFDWLADNLLSPAAKIRYLRVLLLQRNWYLTEREKVIERCRENGGLADADMRALMANIEQTYSETRAAAFSAASTVQDAKDAEDPDAV